MSKERYLNCKYLDAGMDGMLCSMNLCTTCKEFKGEKCSYYMPKNKSKDKKKQNNVNEYFSNILIKNCKRIVEQADKEIEEMAKIIALEMCPTQKEYSKFNNEATCYFARCRNIKNAVDKYLSNLIKDYLYKISREYNSDIAYFSEILSTKYLTVQEFNKVPWENIFKDSVFEVSVNSSINSSYLFNKE